MVKLKSRLIHYLKSGSISLSIGLLLLIITTNYNYTIEILFIAFFSGALIGAFEDILSRSKLTKSKFLVLLLLRTIFYSIIILSTVGSIVILKLSTSNKCTIYEAITDLGAKEFIISNNFHILFFLIILIVTLLNFIRQIDLLLGKGVLLSYLFGKYNKPKLEKKFFLFIDLNSSTHIAEILGTEKYSKFLKNFFADLTNPLLITSGKVFQYCGDEAIVIWDEETGVKNNNVLRFYYLVKREIEKRKNFYEENFGIVPQFKAGIHFGEVLVTEIGELKKDIVYHGDLINSTSRIRSKCTELKKELLVSDEVIKRIKNCTNYTFEDMGCIEFRGKEKKIKLYSAIEIV